MKKLVKKGIVSKEDINGTPKYTIGSLQAITRWMKKDVKHMLSDGIITKEEYDHFLDISTKSSMTSKDKQELQQLMKKWKEEDKR